MHSYFSRLLVFLSLVLCCLNLSVLPVLAQTAEKQWVEKAIVAPPVTGQTRLALIMGNTHYGGSHELKNPENDAKAIAKALATLGFTSTVLLDGSLDQMSDTLHEFSEKIRAAGSSSVALLYYSGHGIQVNGENYLLPVGFKMPANDRDMVRYALSVQSALDEMQGANAQVNIAILDACRNNPFEGTRSAVGKGLARLETQGMLIAFATAAGRTASDNQQGENGLYTSALLKYLQTPGLRLYDIFKNTTKAVYEASKHEQFPYLYDGLIDGNEFYLLPSDNAEAVISSDVDTVARLTVTANVPGARITVDGRELSGDNEYSINLGTEKAKTIELGAKAEGYEPWVKTVTLTRGKATALSVKLVARISPATVVSTNVKMNPKDGAEMILIPAGEFLMGNDNRKVNLSAYYIYKNIVTVAMYEKFCQATGRGMPLAPSFDPNWSQKDHPIVNVAWGDAKAYCEWIGGDLPTEAQWEKAARGTGGQRYPWGEEFDRSRLCCSKVRDEDAGGTMAVGSFPSGASPYGVLDMAGNAWQWCRDYFYASYWNDRNPNRLDPWNNVLNAKGNKSLRGGCWAFSSAKELLPTNRVKSAPKTGERGRVGFRCIYPATRSN